jgi:hypothetical protein
MLPNTEFTPPNYKINRVCLNCWYYSPRASGLRNRYKGCCHLEMVANKDAVGRPTYCTCTCDAHIFNNRSTNQKINNDYNAPLPDDREI